MVTRVTRDKNKVRKAKAKAAFAIVNNEVAFDALTQAQKDELHCHIEVFLLKRELKDEVD